MANAKKCDRCGDFYLDRPADFTPHYRVYECIPGYAEKMYDLCDMCLVELHDFLRGKKVEEYRWN